ncbi:MAG: response regulator transcription factor [Rhodothermales bacterium]|nr:response regulator transcription factor [Rhodothermales bacterium]
MQIDFGEERPNMRIVIADDHHLTRTGLRATLQPVDDVTVVAEAVNGAEALQMVTEYAPDALVLDIEMPQVSGIEVARRLRADGTEVKILALSAYDEPEYVYGLLDAGASGYLMKEEADADMVLQALRGIVNEDEVWISPRLATDLVRRRAMSSRARLESLTDREVEVLQHVANGLDNAGVGEALYISRHTVRNHVERIKAKIDVRTRAELIAWAWHNDLMKA